MVEDVRGFRHLDHEGRHAGADVVVRAHAREDPVGQSDHRSLRGHEAAALREEDDHGGLAQVRRLARHVRPGGDDDLSAFRIEVEIVGDEHARREAPLHQRVATRLDAELHSGVDLRAPPVVVRSSDRQADQRVHHAQGAAAPAQSRCRGCDRGAEVVQDLELASRDPLLGAEHDRFLFLQLGGDVALATGQCLLAGVLIRQAHRVGVADLDVVTEDLVESDLERADACPPTLRRLELCDPLPRAARGVGDRIEVGVVTGADRTALPSGRRRVIDQGSRQCSRQLRRRVHLTRQLSRHQGGAAAERFLDGGDRLERPAERYQLPGGGVTLRGSRDKALEVAHRPQDLQQVVAQSRLGRQLVYRAAWLKDEGKPFARSCRAPIGVEVRSMSATSAGSSRLRTVAASSGMVASGE